MQSLRLRQIGQNESKLFKKSMLKGGRDGLDIMPRLWRKGEHKSLCMSPLESLPAFLGSPSIISMLHHDTNELK